MQLTQHQPISPTTAPVAKVIRDNHYFFGSKVVVALCVPRDLISASTISGKLSYIVGPTCFHPVSSTATVTAPEQWSPRMDLGSLFRGEFLHLCGGKRASGVGDLCNYCSYVCPIMPSCFGKVVPSGPQVAAPPLCFSASSAMVT